MKTRLISGLIGLVIAIVGIWLDERGNRVGAQLFLMTAFALSGPVAVAAVEQGFRKQWFWLALLVATLLHIVFHWSRYHTLPLQSVGTAIIIGAAEAFVLAVVTVILKRTHDSWR
jgi:hypothetical protein